MHLNKLITHLQEFDKTQLKRFNEFVHSPYFKVPSAAIALFDYLELYYPGFDEKRINPSTIAKKVKELPSENKQAKAGTELLKGMERFLATERWYNDERNVLLEMLWEQNKLQWQGLYEDNFQKLDQRLKADEEKSVDYFYQRHLLTSIENNGYRAKIKRNALNNLQPVVKTLDEFYALKKLRFHCELLSRHQILGTPYQKENIDELLLVLEPYNNPGYPYVHLFVNVYQMLNAATYEAVLPYYKHVKVYVSEIEKKGLTQAAAESIEYADSVFLYWFNRGFIEAGNESLWCTELRMKHNRIVEQGKITPILFRNTVSLAVLTGKDSNWIKRFIETYGKYLPLALQDTNLAFGLAQYYQYVKNYDKAMPLYQQAQAKDEPVFNAVVRRWQFMCLYEQNPEDKGVLLDFLVAFEKYVKRNADAFHQFKAIFLNVISHSKKLLAATDRQKAIKDLEKEPYFAGKDWILQQLRKKR